MADDEGEDFNDDVAGNGYETPPVDEEEEDFDDRRRRADGEEEEEEEEDGVADDAAADDAPPDQFDDTDEKREEEWTKNEEAERKMEAEEAAYTEAQKVKALCPNPVRITTPIMTKYEIARLIGARARMLERNAPPLIDVGDEINPLAIAAMELRAHVCPLEVDRSLPDGSCEIWKASELTILDEDDLAYMMGRSF